MEMIEFAKAMADLLQQIEREAGRTFDERKHFAMRNEINFRVFERGGGGRARAVFDDGHLAENFTWSELRKNAADVGADKPGDFHQPVLHKINAITGRAFLKNFPPRGKPPFLRDEPQGLQFDATQATKQGNRFKPDHKFNVW